MFLTVVALLSIAFLAIWKSLDLSFSPALVLLYSAGNEIAVFMVLLRLL